jgi:hypothetical protein
MTQLYNVLGKKVDRLLYQTDLTLLSNTDAIGVEVEIENCRYDFSTSNKEEPRLSRFRYSNACSLNELSTFWHVIKDGSLRDGAEFTFNQPLKGANITAALNDLHMFFEGYIYKNKQVEPSDRTSVHVHLDFRDNSEKEVLNFIMIYLMVERVIFTYCNINRSKNNYCRPLTDSDFMLLLKDFRYYSENGLFPHLVDAIRNTCDKYSALNILPLSNYGSVEFRHHQGTSDINSLKNWINIIFSIKNASLKYTITDLIDYYDRWGIKVLSLIFKGSVFEPLSNNRDMNILLRKGITDVKEVIYYEKLYATKPKISRVKYGKDSLLKAYADKNNISKTNEPNIVLNAENIFNDLFDAPISFDQATPTELD